MTHNPPSPSRLGPDPLPAQPNRLRRARRRRLGMIAGAGVLLAVATALVLMALRDQIVFFYSPTEISEQDLIPGTRVRLGGLVEAGSVVREADGGVSFAVTDTKTSITVAYHGILPDLFREGQGIVAEGALTNTLTLDADTVLAKHDENYMPREVVDALKAQGVWQHGEGGPE